MALSQTSEHEVVSIYPFSDEDRNTLLTHSGEAVLMWATKDGWPVGVTHAFVWQDGKVWLTFAAHRHRAAAIRRDPRVSVNVSSESYGVTAPDGAPTGAITIKGRAAFHDDDETKKWFYPALSKKVNPNSADGEAFFNKLLDTPLRTIISVTPEKFIMYNSGLANRHMAGTVDESELGERLSADATRMNKEREKRGLEPK